MPFWNVFQYQIESERIVGFQRKLYFPNRGDLSSLGNPQFLPYLRAQENGIFQGSKNIVLHSENIPFHKKINIPFFIAI